MKILVVGGAGYIGSHMVKLLRLNQFDVVVLDDLSGGYRDAVFDAELVVGQVLEHKLLAHLFQQHIFDAVMHFASFIQVGESVAEPAKYYNNNLTATLGLLDAMRSANVKHFIFSSTAAVYGNPEYVPIDERHPKHPINPYGRSKWMIEQILEDYNNAYGLKSICLRYFNAAGADQEGKLGERHLPETHLIPLVLQVASGRREEISIYGVDYDTPDGTCIRDYIHVNDLCNAHLLALRRLLTGGESTQFNLGNGTGFSVKEVIETTRKVTGKEIPVCIEARREGDPPILVADSRMAQEKLGWHVQFTDLKTIIADAWEWEKKWPWE